MPGRGKHHNWRDGRFAAHLKGWWRSAVGTLAIGAAAILATVAQTDALPEVLSLNLYNIHTQEKGTFVFKRNGVYDQEGLAKLNAFLRDWRKDQPTHMDPHLFDLIWQVYRQSGSHDYIHVVCGFRSPDTNAMLRRRSKLVAQNSLHMQGKAMDFFIPDVSLPKLREIGLRMQVGGVGFYPTSGSPFVHMDTGSVRHWPRMTRQELVRIFPDGRTLDIPTDGKPLPGYAEALAQYNARKASGQAIATFADATPVNSKPAGSLAAYGKPMQVASAADDSDESDDAIDDATAAAVAPAPARTTVAVASYGTMPTPPLPRLAPRPVVVAAVPPPAAPVTVIPVAAPVRAAAAAVAPAPLQNFAVLAAVTPRGTSLAPDFSFGSSQDWSAPAVPADLARAMADRDQLRRGTSLPIPPTAVVATIDVNRPLRAEAITTAVLRTSAAPAPVPRVLAYAEAWDPLESTCRHASLSIL